MTMGTISWYFHSNISCVHIITNRTSKYNTFTSITRIIWDERAKYYSIIYLIVQRKSFISVQACTILYLKVLQRTSKRNNIVSYKTMLSAKPSSRFPLPVSWSGDATKHKKPNCTSFFQLTNPSWRGSSVFRPSRNKKDITANPARSRFELHFLSLFLYVYLINEVPFLCNWTVILEQ